MVKLVKSSNCDAKCALLSPQISSARTPRSARAPRASAATETSPETPVRKSARRAAAEEKKVREEMILLSLLTCVMPTC